MAPTLRAVVGIFAVGAVAALLLMIGGIATSMSTASGEVGDENGGALRRSDGRRRRLGLMNLAQYIHSDPATYDRQVEMARAEQSSVGQHQQPQDFIDLDSMSVVLLSYHKTGFFITRHLFDMIEKIKSFDGAYLSNSFGTLKHTDLHFVEENSMYRRISSSFSCDAVGSTGVSGNENNVIPPGTKVLHFVRDPFEMAVSNYLYHSQDPTPEQWVIEHNPCAYDEDMANVYLRNVGVSPDDMRAVVDMCQRYMADDPNRYYDHLQRLLVYDGLRLATAEFLVDAQELLRQSSNCKCLNLQDDQVMATKMSDWLTEPKSMTVGTLDFLFGASVADEAKQEIAAEMEHIFLKSKNTKHSTQANIIHTDRNILMDRLSKDKILGPVLHQLKKAMEEASCL